MEGYLFIVLCGCICGCGLMVHNDRESAKCNVNLRVQSFIVVTIERGVALYVERVC